LRVTGTQRTHLQISDRVRDNVAFHNENSVSGELREVHFAVMLYVLVSALVHTRIVKANLNLDRDCEKRLACFTNALWRRQSNALWRRLLPHAQAHRQTCRQTRTSAARAATGRDAVPACRTSHDIPIATMPKAIMCACIQNLLCTYSGMLPRLTSANFLPRLNSANFIRLRKLVQAQESVIYLKVEGLVKREVAQ